MKKGDHASIRIINTWKEKCVPETETFSCTVHKCEREKIYFLLTNEKLENVDLDCLYECEIAEQKYKISGEGVVKSRFYCEFGPMIEFEMKKGFYKNSINLVDKQ